MLYTKYFSIHIFHSCFFYVNPWDSNLTNCSIFPRYFRESISDSHGTGDDLRASGIDREYDRTTDTCQISDSSRGYRTRTSQDWSRTIKNFVTMHAASSLSLPPLSPSLLRRYGLACSTAVKRVGSRVWSTHGAPHVHVCACGWTWMARLPRYRSSSWPPRVMPYPLALHNNLPRRVCSDISARTLPPALLFLSPVRPPFCLLIGVTAVYFVLLLSISSPFVNSTP